MLKRFPFINDVTLKREREREERRGFKAIYFVATVGNEQRVV
jgi:hypothetical protein